MSNQHEEMTVFGERIPKLDELPPERQLYWQKYFSFAAKICGCRTSANTVGIVITGYIIVCYLTRLKFNLITAALLFVLSAAAGKLFGMARARRTFLRSLGILREELERYRTSSSSKDRGSPRKDFAGP